MSRSLPVVLPWSLQAILQWKDEHWPLSFHWVSSLQWAWRCQASWSMLLGRLRGPLPLGLPLCTPPNGPSCPHFIMCWLGIDYSARWLWSSNPKQCLRKTGHILANLYLATWPQDPTIWTIRLPEVFIIFNTVLFPIKAFIRVEICLMTVLVRAQTQPMKLKRMSG